MEATTSLATPAAADERIAGITTLTERVDRLERENRQLRREALLLAAITTIAAGVLSTMLVKSAFDTPSSMRLANPRRLFAQSFVLTDAHGEPRAELKFVPITENEGNGKAASRR